MRVAVIRRRIHSYGGVEGYALRLIQGLKKRGVDVEVLAEEYESQDGIKFYPVKIKPFSFKPAPILFNRCCQEVLKKEKFDIIHSLERTWPQDIYRAGEGCHAEFMRTLSIEDRISPRHLLTLYIEKKAFFSSRYIMANSERVKREIMTHYGISKDRIVVIYTGVDTERFNPQKILGLEKKELVILFIGSGFRRKGLKLLLKALARVDTSLQFKLLVAGKGRSNYYSRIANSLGLKGKVKFLGLVKDIDSLYASADFLVLPSIYEPFSNTCLEAMACGIPVLTTRCNGISEILEEDGLRDLIIENPFDIEEITRKIMGFVSKNQRQIFSLKVRELARKFSFSRHLDEVMKLYKEI